MKSNSWSEHKREFLNEPWSKVAGRRRRLLLCIMLPSTFTASALMSTVLPHRGATVLEMAIVLVFGILFAWISMGFWTVVAGFFTLLRGVDRFTVTFARQKEDDRVRAHVRTAILFPVCNEEVRRVMAGLRATYLSLERTGQGANFHFHILSDSNDPDVWVEEEAAWAELCRELGASGRIFYRRRRVNLKRKSGNVADFCRRYGAHYTYMVVFDADSVMTGPTLVRMVQVMERRRNVGILQTAPAPVGRETLIARVQQFAARAYGPFFAAGLHYWHLGDSQFWGHNAILRVKPFMQHCCLPRLPGPPPLGGDILSHDFVESALMRRAGWSVWLAYDLPGSYEEMPPTLLDELKRDRRWCQGNMQHLRLVFTKGLFPAHRALFLNGIMSYGSAFLWFSFLALSTVEAFVEAMTVPTYFPAATKVLFFPVWPVWPVWDPRWAKLLLTSTGILLFLPKIIAYVLLLFKGRGRLFGGPLSMFLSILGEVVLSTLLAPVRMLFHARFVFATLMGFQVGWGSQNRDDTGTTWFDALRHHGFGSIFGLLWGASLALVNPTFLSWISPIVVSLALAVPLSVYTSRPSLGLLARRLGLFMVPEEIDKPWELQEVEEYSATPSADAHRVDLSGFARAVVDPQANALHLRMLGRPRSLSPAIRQRRQSLVDKALEKGASALSKREKKELLYDPACMVQLHQRVWAMAPLPEGHPWACKVLTD